MSQSLAIPEPSEMTQILGVGAQLVNLLPNEEYPDRFILFVIDGSPFSDDYRMIGPEWAHKQKPMLMVKVSDMLKRIKSGARYKALVKKSAVT